MDGEPTASALDGLLIADFTRVLAGPYATMLFADLGATVVKVERPGTGDDTRLWGPPYATDGQSTYFQSVNRNKLSVTLDLADDLDQATARRLAACADVVVENYKPGGLDRYGLGYSQVREVNPRIVYCSITGFGSDAGRDLPGYDLLVQAMGGLMSVTGVGEPTKAGVAVVDVITGLHAAVGVLAALRQRERSGVGQRIEVSLLGALLAGMVNQSAAYVGAGEVPGSLGNAHPSIAPYEVFATADAPLVIAVGNDGQFARLCATLGAAQLADDERYRTNSARVNSRLALKAELERLLREQRAQYWREALVQASVPAGEVNDLGQAFELAARMGLEPIVSVDDPRRGEPVRQVANPMRFSETDIQYRSAPPRLGEDQEAVLALIAGREANKAND